MTYRTVARSPNGAGHTLPLIGCFWPAECRRDEVIVAGYEALPEVYEWLIPDAKLTPEGSVAALGDLVQSLPSNARVLDCSCGTGQLAVSPASRGLNVVATDASAGITAILHTNAEATIATARDLLTGPVVEG